METIDHEPLFPSPPKKGKNHIIFNMQRALLGILPPRFQPSFFLFGILCLDTNKQSFILLSAVAGRKLTNAEETYFII